MRGLGYGLGWFLLLAALAVAGWEVFVPNAAVGFTLRPLGELWYSLDPGSLNLLQAVVERYIWAPLWDPAIVGVLRLPALLVFAVPAVAILAVCYGVGGRRRRRRFH
jgi:hypothetical protein